MAKSHYQFKKHQKELANFKTKERGKKAAQAGKQYG